MSEWGVTAKARGVKTLETLYTWATLNLPNNTRSSQTPEKAMRSRDSVNVDARGCCPRNTTCCFTGKQNASQLPGLGTSQDRKGWCPLPRVEENRLGSPAGRGRRAGRSSQLAWPAEGPTGAPVASSPRSSPTHSKGPLNAGCMHSSTERAAEAALGQNRGEKAQAQGVNSSLSHSLAV